MSDQRRWILFLVLSILVIQFFAMLAEKDRAKLKAARRGETTGTLAATSPAGTTGTTEMAAGPADTPPLAGGVPRVIENTSITIAAHPGEITSTTMEKYTVGLDSTGAIIGSWRIMDPGSQSFVRTVETSCGIEMVRRIPTGDPGVQVTQTWPLEIGLREQNSRGYEDFNNIAWQKEEVRERGKEGQIVSFLSPDLNGVRLRKIYTFAPGKYMAGLRITVINDNDSTLTFYDGSNRGLVLRWGPGLVERQAAEEKSSEEAYDAAVYRVDNEVRAARPVHGKEPIEGDGRIEWAGVEAKFFAALIIPRQPLDVNLHPNRFFRALVPAAHVVREPNGSPRKNFVPPLTMELATEKFEVPARGTHSFDFDVYVGPKKHSILKQHGSHMQALVFHDSWSFMRVIYLLLTDFLNWIYRFVHNYGIAIILLTIAVRLATFPLTQHSIRLQAKTMSEQQKIKPFLDQINEKYKDDPQEKNRQVWKIYQEHGISPFAPMRGCVPILLQMPVFVGLYRVCNDTIDLQGATFLWMHDLSKPDHFLGFGANLPLLGPYLNLLPILMGATQILTSWVASSHMKIQDPTQAQMQKQMMYMMPVVFTFMLYSMPAGLMIYWITSNIWQIGQTLVTNRIMKREEALRAAQEQPVLPYAMPAPVAEETTGPGKTRSKGKGKGK